MISFSVITKYLSLSKSSRFSFPLSRTMSSVTSIKDYSRFLSPLSLRREPSAIRALQPLLKIPGMISLGGGMPNPALFPLKGLRFDLNIPGKHQSTEIELTEAQVNKALQYSATAGLEELVDALWEIQHREHGLKRDDKSVERAVCVFNGSQDGLAKAFEMFLTEGDPVLVESPLYSGSLAILKPLRPKFVEVQTDQDGIKPDFLAHILDNWPKSQRKPKVLYTVPVGSNPTGSSTTLSRKKEVLQLAAKHDFIIIEDDPYYFLQFSSSANSDTEKRKSYISMDVEGRVLRFDSFSKVLAAGMRIGVCTGPKQLIDRLILHSQSTNLHPNGISQMILYRILSTWTVSEFSAHLKTISDFYRSQLQSLIFSLEKYMYSPVSLAEWHVPTAGMFLWVRLLGIEDSSVLIKEKATEKKVLVLPGGEFFPEVELCVDTEKIDQESDLKMIPGKDKRNCAWVRMAYSTVTPEEMDEAVKRLAELLKSARGII